MSEHTKGETIEYFENKYTLTARQNPITGDWILFRKSKIQLGIIEEKRVAQHILLCWNAHDPLTQQRDDLLDMCKLLLKTLLDAGYDQNISDVKTQAEDLIASVQKSKQSVTPKVSESNI